MNRIWAAFSAAMCGVPMLVMAAGPSTAGTSLPVVPFEVRDLASDRGISENEAAERLDWQKRAASLNSEAASSLGATTFAGLWADPHDGDRLKLGVVDPQDPQVRARVNALLQRHDLTAATDVIPSLRSLSSLRDEQAARVAQARAANASARNPLGVDIALTSNAIEIIVPEEGDLTPAQQRYVAQAEAEGANTRRSATAKRRLEACNTGGVLYCDPPLRGGTRQYWTSNTSKACTNGFFARSNVDNAPFIVTAGHCFTGSAGGTSVSSQNALGTAYSIGRLHNYLATNAGDWAAVRIENASWLAQPQVAVLDRADTSLDLNYVISSDQDPFLYQRVCFTGSASRTSDCGEVTTVNQWDGQSYVNRANYCGSTGGDSGAPLFSLHVAQGIHLGSYIIAGNNFGECDKLIEMISSVEGNLNVSVQHG